TKSESSSLRFWETTTGRRLAELETDDYLLRGFALSADGKRFVSAGSFKGADGFPLNGAIRLWDASTRKEIRTIKLGAEERPELAAISPDGKALFAAVRSEVRAWDADTGHERGRLRLDRREANTLAVSPDGKLLAVSEVSGAVHLWEWRTKGQPRKLYV